MRKAIFALIGFEKVGDVSDELFPDDKELSIKIKNYNGSKGE